MTFDEAARHYSAWRQQLDAGAISPEQFQQAMAQMQVTDETGTVWRMDPATGAWLRWDGQQWVHPKQAQPPPPIAAAPAKSPGPSASGTSSASPGPRRWPPSGIGIPDSTPTPARINERASPCS